MSEKRKPIILLTGATDGLGRRVAEDLAANGHILLLHGRNPDKGNALVSRICSATDNQQVYYYNADLASLQEVRNLAATVTWNHPCLDVLINNAGLGGGPGPKKRQISRDGFELRFAVNYLAPYLLTRLLLPLLRRGAESNGTSRIVNIASSCQQAIDFDNPMLERDYDGLRAYCQSKLALVMFTFDLARELQGSGITVNALHPASAMNTKLLRQWHRIPRHSVKKGAQAVISLALSNRARYTSGQYFNGGKIQPAKDPAYDEEARQRLRRISREWTGL
ncbi:MAG: SDR family NAD(P)-dependent oxidoreductase [Syntrophotaleaceae bacterium]